ncbi:hypothetical protein BDB01DRAFT_24132 [Pilobolus umbonatus]|nr:hypothetical protein BDB01DRAFT_24132 [Pilobolus umbonatus]
MTIPYVSSIINQVIPAGRSLVTNESTWTQLVDKQSDIVFGRIDCDQYTEYCQNKGIQQMPTIQIRGANGWKEYEGDLLLDNIETFIEENKVQQNPKGENVEIKDITLLRHIAESKEPWFIKFYAPWCGHCNHLKPVWDKMASSLQNKVNVGEVNCETSRALCNEYQVSGLPTLIYFVHGKNLRYNGRRNLESLVEFATKKSGSLVQPCNKRELLRSLKESDVNLVYIHPTEDREVLSILESIAPEFMEDVPFYSTDKMDALAKYGFTAATPTVVLVKDGSYVLYDNIIEKDRLLNWIQAKRQPLVTRVETHNANNILKGEKVIVLCITRTEDTQSIEKLRKIARVYKEGNNREITFAEIDGVRFGDYISRVYGIHHDQTPALVVIDPKKAMYYTHMRDETVFDLNHPNALLRSLNELDRLKGMSTRSSNFLDRIDQGLLYIADHWMMITMVTVLLFGVMYLYFMHQAKQEDIRHKKDN